MTKVAWLDESGNMGFNFAKPGTSAYFIITLLIADKRGPVVKAVKRVFNSLSKTDKKHSYGILHAYYEKQQTRERLLKLLSGKDILVAGIVLDKRKVRIAPDTHILYASMVNMLLNRLFIDGILDPDEALELVASKMETSKNQTEQFAAFVMTGAKTENLIVNPAKPSEDKGLQAVDFVSWALYRKFEYGNSDCTDILGEKVVRIYDYLQGVVTPR
jgi:hypothetical protein